MNQSINRVFPAALFAVPFSLVLISLKGIPVIWSTKMTWTSFIYPSGICHCDGEVCFGKLHVLNFEMVAFFVARSVLKKNIAPAITLPSQSEHQASPFCSKRFFKIIQSCDIRNHNNVALDCPHCHKHWAVSRKQNQCTKCHRHWAVSRRKQSTKCHRHWAVSRKIKAPNVTGTEQFRENQSVHHTKKLSVHHQMKCQHCKRGVYFIPRQTFKGSGWVGPQILESMRMGINTFSWAKDAMLSIAPAITLPSQSEHQASPFCSKRFFKIIQSCDIRNHNNVALDCPHCHKHWAVSRKQNQCTKCHRHWAVLRKNKAPNVTGTEQFREKSKHQMSQALSSFEKTNQCTTQRTVCAPSNEVSALQKGSILHPSPTPQHHGVGSGDIVTHGHLKMSVRAAWIIRGSSFFNASGSREAWSKRRPGFL